MSTPTRPFPRRLRLCLLALALGTTLAAQSSEPLVSLDLPEAPLAQSLNALARQSGAQILFATDIASGKRAPALRGTYDVREGLQRLLQGQGLRVQERGPGVFVVQPDPAAGEADPLATPATGDAVSLPTLEVRGIRWGETYTVERSTSANRLDLEIKEIPQSISVITQAQIEDQNLVQTVDVLTQVPGLMVAQYGVPGAGRVRYYSRGFEIKQIQLDGMPINAGGEGLDLIAAVDTAVFESVDVVRGSTGLTTGVGDPSASVNLKRKRPTPNFQGSASLGYGSWGRVRGELDLSGPLAAEGRLRGRLVAAYQGGGHWMDRVETESKTVFGALEFDLGDDTQLNAGVIHYDHHGDAVGPYGTAAYQRMSDNYVLYPNSQQGPHYNPAADWSFIDTQLTNVFVQLEHRFGDDWRLNLHYGYNRARTDRIWGVLGDEYFDEANGVANLGIGHSYLPADIHSVDAYLYGKFELFGREHDVVAGFNGHEATMNGPTYGSLSMGNISFEDWDNGAYPLPNFLDSYGFTAETLGWPQRYFDYYNNFLQASPYWQYLTEKQWGGYLSTRLRPTDRLSVILGTRLTQWRRHKRIYENNPEQWFVDPDYELAWDILRKDFRENVGKVKSVPYAGVVVELTPAITAYASYTGIYQPNIDTAYGSDILLDPDGNPLPPIEGNSREIGVNAGFHDNALNLHLAAFETRQTNLATGWGTCADPDLSRDELGNVISCVSWLNRGDLVRGGEFTFAGLLSERWQVSGGYTLLKSYNQRYANLGSVAYATAYERPRHQFKLFTSWRPNDRLTVGGGLTWRSRIEVDTRTGGHNSQQPPSDSALEYERAMSHPSYAVIGLMGRYRVNDAVSVGINIDNLLDETYRVNANGNYYGAPRNATVRVNWRF